MNPSTFPAFVINLEKAGDRRRFMEVQLAMLPELDVRFIKAVDGRTLGEAELAGLYDDARAKRTWGCSLTTSEIGCALSHLEACRQIVEQNLEVALVLEDDILISGFFPEILAATLPQLSPAQPEVILFAPVKSCLRLGARQLTPTHRLCQVRRGAWHAAAYLITRPAAEIQLAKLQPVHVPADYWNRAIREGWFSLRAVIPYAVSFTAAGRRASTIGSRGAMTAGTEASWLKRLRWRLNLGDRLRRLSGWECFQTQTW